MTRVLVDLKRYDALVAAEQERDELAHGFARLADQLAEQAALVEAAVAYGAECEAYDAAEQAWRDAPHGDAVTQRARDSAMDQLEQAHDELTEAAVAYYRARQAEPGGAPADGSGEGQGG